MSASIRGATRAADGAAVWDILRPAFRAGDTYAVDPAIGEAEALDYWFAAPNRVFLAEEGGVALGTSLLRANAGGPGDHVANAAFVTAEAARGRGVARAMLAHALETARAAGFTAMQFNFVVATNSRAVDTWTRAGFATVGRVPGAFRHPRHGPVDALVMHRSLV